MRRLIALLASVTAVFVVAAAPVAADPGAPASASAATGPAVPKDAVGLSPAMIAGTGFAVTLDAGASEEHDLVVSNHTANLLLTVKLGATDATGNLGTAAASWLAFGDDEIQLAPHVATTVAMTIAVPHDTQPGSALAHVSATVVSAVSAADGSPVSGIATDTFPVSIVVSGTPNAQIAIADVHRVDQGSTHQLALVLRNFGAQGAHVSGHVRVAGDSPQTLSFTSDLAASRDTTLDLDWKAPPAGTATDVAVDLEYGGGNVAVMVLAARRHAHGAVADLGDVDEPDDRLHASRSVDLDQPRFTVEGVVVAVVRDAARDPRRGRGRFVVRVRDAGLAPAPRPGAASGVLRSTAGLGRGLDRRIDRPRQADRAAHRCRGAARRVAPGRARGRGRAAASRAVPTRTRPRPVRHPPPSPPNRARRAPDRNRPTIPRACRRLRTNCPPNLSARRLRRRATRRRPEPVDPQAATMARLLELDRQRRTLRGWMDSEDSGVAIEPPIASPTAPTSHRQAPGADARADAPIDAGDEDGSAD